MAKKIKKSVLTRVTVMFCIFITLILLYVGYWVSMLVWTKEITLDGQYTAEIPFAWHVSKHYYYDTNELLTNIYVFEKFGRNGSISIKIYRSDLKNYIQKYDLAGLKYKSIELGNKKGILFEPDTTNTNMEGWKIYLFEIDNKIFSIQMFYTKENANLFEKLMFSKIESNFIDSGLFYTK